MPSSHSRRRRELAKAVAARKRAAEWAPQRDTQNGFIRTLNLLNTYGVLEEIQQGPPGGFLAFGPRAVYAPRGTDPYAGVVIWLRASGYHNYQRLTLLGLWACGEATAPLVIAGTRTLRYNGQPYSPESYFRHLRTDFTVYYEKSAPPPLEENRLYTAQFDAAQRLGMRKAIAEVLKGWRHSTSTN